jgi:hypothetical protein
LQGHELARLHALREVSSDRVPSVKAGDTVSAERASHPGPVARQQHVGRCRIFALLGESFVAGISTPPRPTCFYIIGPARRGTSTRLCKSEGRLEAIRSDTLNGLGSSSRARGPLGYKRRGSTTRNPEGTWRRTSVQTLEGSSVTRL